MSEDRWRKLEVWKLADDLAYKIYHATKTNPKEEQYGITSQIRWAALSIPTNIVEGYGRRSEKELLHFINISLGSLSETKYLLHFSDRLGILSKNEYINIKEGYEVLGKKLWRFYQSIKN